MRDMSVGADSRGDARRASRAAGDDDDEDEEEDGEGEETYEEDGQIVDPVSAISRFPSFASLVMRCVMLYFYSDRF